MDCPTCHQSNPDDASFCGVCGASLAIELICAACGRANPHGTRFCHGCGKPLTAHQTSASARAAAGANETLPTSFGEGRYVVHRLLGEGGKKRVYLAHDMKLDRDVAFALIKTDGLDDDGLTRIRREAQAMGRLGDHPHIVAVFDIGEERGQPYLVSQLMAGGDVEGLIERAPERRVPLEQALQIADQVCQALEHAHGLGVIHRDLKPGNVWLSGGAEGQGSGLGDAPSPQPSPARGEGVTLPSPPTPKPQTLAPIAKLGDFGLAVALDRSRLTQAGMMVGTVAYMAPEQALGGEVTPRSDLYSLGAMLYELATGRPPFIGDDSVAIITQHLNTPPVSPSWHVPDVPPGLETLILRLLEKDPGKRPASASEVRAMLASVHPHPNNPLPEREGGALAPLPLGEADRRPTGPRTAVAWGAAEGEPGHGEASPSPLYQRVFVGRENELRQLQSAFDRALSGQGSLTMVVGEPGIGKTALCEQLATYVAVRGGRTLVGHCYEEGSLSLPYLAFVEALRTYVMSREPERLQEDLGSGAAEVARIISEVRDRVPVELRPAGDPEDDRWRLLQAVSGFLRNASQVQPLVLILEDLHWADRGTLDLLLHLARNLQGARLLIVGNYRDVEVDRSHPLSGTLADLRRVEGFVRISLRGLTIDEVHRMYAQLRGQEVSWAAAEAVYHQTEGNPLFVQEILRFFVEEGLVVREGGRYVRTDDRSPEMIVPEGLRDVIGKRLSRLSAECNRLLAVAAVIGRDFNLDTLRTVAGVAEDTLLTSIEEAVRIGVLEEHARPGQVSYRFAHAFFRQTLYEEMIAPRRLRLHQEVARALETEYGSRRDDHAAELAEHFAQSTDRADLARAVEYGEVAARRAMAVYAYGEATRLLEQAVAIQEVLGPDDLARRCDLLLTLSEALMPADDPLRAAEEICEEAFTFAVALDDGDRAGRSAQLALAALDRFGGSQAPSRPAYRTWVERADVYAQPGTIARVYADVARSLLHQVQGELVLAWEAGQRSLALAREVGDQEATCRAGAALLQVTAPEHLEELLALAREISQVGSALSSWTFNRLHFFCANIFLSWGERARADAEVAALAEFGERTRDPNARSSALQQQRHRLFIGGQLEAAVVAAQQAAETEVRMGNEGLQVFALLRRGQVDEALATVGTTGRALGADETTQTTMAFRALCLAHAGSTSEAAVLLRQLIPEPSSQPRGWRTPPLSTLLEAALGIQDRQLVASLATHLAPAAPLSYGVAAGSSCPARLLGMASALLGRPDEARAYFVQALTACAKIGFRPEIALTRLCLSELLLEHYPDERTESLDHLDFAIQEFEAMKMAPSLERALALKASLA